MINLTWVELPTINQRYGMSRKTGKLFLNSKYRNFKRDLVSVCKKGKINPPYKVIIELQTGKDIDSTIKVILDALQEAKILDNDKNVHQLIVEKVPIKRGLPESLTVDVHSLEKM